MAEQMEKETAWKSLVCPKDYKKFTVTANKSFNILSKQNNNRSFGFRTKNIFSPVRNTHLELSVFWVMQDFLDRLKLPTATERIPEYRVLWSTIMIQVK